MAVCRHGAVCLGKLTTQTLKRSSTCFSVVAAQTEQDAAKRVEFYNDAEQIVVSEAAWLPLWWGVDSKALVKPWVQDYQFSSLTIAKFKDVWLDK